MVTPSATPIPICLALLVIASVVQCQSPTPFLSTAQGIYYPNTTLSGVEQFLGIPYAEPPVGILRFAPPVPYTSGDPSHQVDAARYGPGCLQYRTFAEENGLSEDCLTLNIFRPTTTPFNYTRPYGYNNDSQPLLPILVFIYGGANLGGQSKWYTASSLVTHSVNMRKPIVAVTLNYRTGGLGFLSNTLFARQNPPLLNIGLQDQRAALQWLRTHATAFGGDPERIVIFGQSAGSFNVWMQARYQAVAGGETLFRGAIMESGGPGSLALRGFEPGEGDDFLHRSLDALGCPVGDEALACLRSQSADALTDLWYGPDSELVMTLDDLAQMPIGFGVDGTWVGSRDYWDEPAAAIPMIVGVTLNEGSLYGRVPTALATNETYLSQIIAMNLRTADLSLTRPVLDTYFNHTAVENGRGYHADPTAPDSYYIGEAVLGDAMQDIPRRINLGRHASGMDAPGAVEATGRHPQTWGYRWSQKPPLSLFDEPFYGFPPDVPVANKIRTGVLHASELGYAFGDVRAWPDASPGDERLADLVQSMWISFTYDLDPNNHGIAGVPHWDNYSPLCAKVFEFEDQGSNTSRMVPDDMRLDSYNAYKDAAAKAGLPALPEIRL